MLAQNIMLYGSTRPLPERVPLRAGPLSLIYESGDLRYIRLGEREVIRRVYAAVRDHNWVTVPTVLSPIELHIESDTFRIRYQVDNRLNDIAFQWHGEITGTPDGTITFTFDGEAQSRFLRNRIGFCILHPIRECAGAACRIEHDDGMIDETSFPEFIAPQMVANGRPIPPGCFHSMRTMTHQVSPDVWAKLRFEGDLFELEDQRNWTDASYKTFCTPLQLPFPVEVAKGTRIHQQIRLSLQGKVPTVKLNAPVPIDLALVDDATPQPLPKLGVSLAQTLQPLSEREVDRLRALKLTYLRAELKLSETGWTAYLQHAIAQANRVELPLEFVLVVSDEADAELDALTAALDAHKPSIYAFLSWQRDQMIASDACMALVRQKLARYAMPIGAGSKANFAELNRAWPDPALIDFVSVAANPQVHATDNASLAETGAAFIPLVATAHHALPNTPLSINALTLKPQFNAVATGPVKDTPPDELPSSVDPRQMSLLGAGWTLSSLKYLSETGGVREVACFETVGWRGIMETEQGSRLPEKFPSLPGCVFPIYHVLAALGEMRDGQVIAIRSSEPLRVEAMLIRQGGRQRLLLANLESAPQTVRLPAFGGQVRLRWLDETTFTEATRTPELYRASSGDPLTDPHSLRLRPYALACLDFEGTHESIPYL